MHSRLATFPDTAHASASSPGPVCPLCGGAAFDPHAHVADANFSRRITSFDVLRCRNCGLAIMQPPPTPRDLDELYLEDRVFSKTFPNPNTGRLFFRNLETLYARHGLYYEFVARRCLHFLSPRRAEPAILDIGCSTGRLLGAFRRLRPAARLRGVDIDPDARQAAPPDIAPLITTGDVFDVDLSERFDIITMCFIIEHLLDFRPDLTRAVRLLAPGGVLCLSTPDLDSAKARRLGARWRLLSDPRQKLGHLRWFNRSSLTRLARRQRLEILDLRNRGELLYHLHPLLQRILRTLLGTFPAPSGARFIRNYQLRLLWAVFFDGLLAQRLGYGDSLFLFARKRGAR
ncbi:MAG: class I SAM-dependent methyltransferase [Planctomycetota bacterium]|nr:class I SAM-dependent methyltransferase [Planctomycetota bacterium]